MKKEKVEKEDKKQKVLSIIFYILFVGSTLIDILIILQAYDPCRIDANKKCLIAYKIVGTDSFLYITWVQSILAIFVSVIYTIMGVIDKKWKNIVLGILGVMIPAVVWTSTLGALDIIWGL